MAAVLGLPTLDLGIPGRPPLPPSYYPWAPHLNQLGVWGSDVSSPSGSGAKPQPTNDLVHISEPKGAGLVATVFVHFHNNKFKFLYKHKTAYSSRYSVSLRAKHSVGSRGKVKVSK